MGLLDFFKKKKQRTMLDEVHDATIKLFRSIGESNGFAPTKELSDEKIIKISPDFRIFFKQTP